MNLLLFYAYTKLMCQFFDKYSVCNGKNIYMFIYQETILWKSMTKWKKSFRVTRFVI